MGSRHVLQSGHSPFQQQPIADGNREAVAQRIRRQLGRNREQDQDRDADTGLAQLQRLVERSDAQAGDAIGNERPCHRHCTVAVAISLDDRLDSRSRRKQPLQQSDIADHCVEVDLQPGGLRQGRKRDAWRQLDQ
jgi:hypothetical protein